jgi:hypothetical protein
MICDTCIANIAPFVHSRSTSITINTNINGMRKISLLFPPQTIGIGPSSIMPVEPFCLDLMENIIMNSPTIINAEPKNSRYCCSIIEVLYSSSLLISSNTAAMSEPLALSIEMMEILYGLLHNLPSSTDESLKL